MHVTNWTRYSPAEAVYRRAGGRRRYNAERQRQAEQRRQLVAARFLSVVAEFMQTKRFSKGWQTRLARELGVSRMQIWRDFQAVCANDRALADIAFMLDTLRIITKPIPGLKGLIDY